jgi:APA family basic amino acid/polyamine antiporter
MLYVYAVPAEEMKGVISIGGLTANNLFGRSMDQFFSLFIALLLLSSISVLIIIGPRVYFAMAKSGHFFPVARKVNRYKVPGVSIILQSSLGILFVITGTFDQIITFLSFSLGIFPILAVLGVFKLRMKGESVFRIPGYPVYQVLFIVFSLAILVLAYIERPVESSIAIGVIVVGIPVFYLLKRAQDMRSPDHG